MLVRDSAALQVSVMPDSDSDNEPLFREARKFLREFNSDSSARDGPTRHQDPRTNPPKSLGDFDSFLKPLLSTSTAREYSDAFSESSNHIHTPPSSPDIKDQYIIPNTQIGDGQPARINIAKAVRWDVLPNITPPPTAAKTALIYPPSARLLARLDPSEIHPKYTLTVTEQTAKLIKKLVLKFGISIEQQLLEAGQSITNIGRQLDPQGIHVFIDISNIEIGFYDRLKSNRNIDKNTMKKAPPFSFSLFSLILERGRPASKRILAGSISHQNSPTQSLPGHIIQAERCGYEINILERVYKPQDVRRMKRMHPGGYSTTSGNSSASESAHYRRYVTKEQAVDEILHLKMCQSMIDQAIRNDEPSTMVIASGDSAPAEFSDGFFRNVERALEAGWNVEVVAWRDGLGKDYKTKKFLDKWEDKFMVIELDDFAEDLLAFYVYKYSVD